MNKEAFYEMVDAEHNEQKRDSDKYKHAYEWLGLVMEEVGEVAECVNENRCPIAELVQVATLIQAWVTHTKRVE